MFSLHFDIVESTNITAKNLLSSYDEIIITADVQTHGKGRNGKVWQSGNACDILFSHGMKANVKSQNDPLLLQACSAISVQAFLLDILPPTAKIQIKYPNDVYVKHGEKVGKISGSLIETEYSGNSLQSIITGIGVNINSRTSELPNVNPSISVFEILGYQRDLQETRKQFIDIYTTYVIRREDLWGSWKEQLHLIDKNIQIAGDDKEYLVKDILVDGRLYCLSDDGERYIHSGDSILYNLFD